MDATAWQLRPSPDNGRGSTGNGRKERQQRRLQLSVLLALYCNNSLPQEYAFLTSQHKGPIHDQDNSANRQFCR